MSIDDLQQFRRDKDAFFGDSRQSLIPHGGRLDWRGLSYFEPLADLVFDLPIDPGDGSELSVQMSDGQIRAYRRAGHITFEVEGDRVRLTLLEMDGHDRLFVPFRDSTSGKETYGAGRYLDVTPRGDGTVTTDFNYAYNPYCAYDDAYSCPLPPAENRLRVPIRAGERSYKTAG
ncbi:MAG: DUF1684 domain-containing protein [Acidimicrobiia bacterium]|nr:DUF1684 domain-containing protein [Acidimicrobiia bacterium]